jgi:hypothetical protein
MKGFQQQNAYRQESDAFITFGRLHYTKKTPENTRFSEVLRSGGGTRIDEQIHCSPDSEKQNRSLLATGGTNADNFAKFSELLREWGFTGTQLVLIGDAMREAGLEIVEVPR